MHCVATIALVLLLSLAGCTAAKAQRGDSYQSNRESQDAVDKALDDLRASLRNNANDREATQPVSGLSLTGIVGNTYYFSDGSHATVIGDTIHFSDGSHGTIVGDTLYHSDGSHATVIGDTVYHSSGASAKSVTVTTPGGTASAASLPSNSITYSVEKAATEFDTTSIVDIPPSMWRSGKPLVRKGLEIKTKKPELPILTRLTTSPGNPVCEVLFGKDGVPVSCKILQSSGFADIDGPVRDALCRWRAKGSQLEKLAPGKTLTFRIRFILN